MGCGSSSGSAAKLNASKFNLPDKKEVKEALKQVNLDKDKKISVEELQKALTKLNVTLSTADAEAVIKLVDQNGDMQLDEKEFYHLVYVCSNIESGNAMKTAFLVGDKDCGGTIDSKEIKALIAKIGDGSDPDDQKLISLISDKKNVDFDGFKDIVAKLAQ